MKRDTELIWGLVILQPMRGKKRTSTQKKDGHPCVGGQGTRNLKKREFVTIVVDPSRGKREISPDLSLLPTGGKPKTLRNNLEARQGPALILPPSLQPQMTGNSQDFGEENEE